MEDRYPQLDAVYQFLQTYITTNGYAPTVRETADALGMSTDRVRQYLNVLDGMGRIERTPYLWRDVRLVDKP